MSAANNTSTCNTTQPNFVEPPAVQPASLTKKTSFPKVPSPLDLHEIEREVLEYDRIERLRRFNESMLAEKSIASDRSLASNGSTSENSNLIVDDSGVYQETPAKTLQRPPRVVYSSQKKPQKKVENQTPRVLYSAQLSNQFPLPAQWEVNENDVPDNTRTPDEPSFKHITVCGMKYVVLKELGKGGSSIVYHCFEHSSGTECALKCVYLKQDPIVSKGFLDEVEMLLKLKNCQRVIKMHAHELSKDGKKLYMVLEKGFTDLSRVIKQLTTNSQHMPTYKLIYYWMEMLYAVKEIHDNGVVHSDLKPANFMEVKGCVKLIDFGISSCIQTDMTSVVKNVLMGTFNYMSPEAIQQQEQSTGPNSPGYGKPKYKISFKSDVWSLGCILYQMVYGRTPFQHINNIHSKLLAILNPKHKIEFPPADHPVPLYVLRTITACLKYDMKSRPTINEIITQYENFFNR